MDILKEILENKRQEVAHSKRTSPVIRLQEMPDYKRRCFSLQKSLRIKNIGIIAEIKKASPSRGVIREDFEPVKIAHQYVNGGSSAISVLTDKKYFQGNIRFIADIRSFVPVPILRKDFIIDSYQLIEAKAFGADSVLLIAAALEKNQLFDLHAEANDTGLECLVEVHDERELEILNLSQVKILGINNRNLSDFTVDISTTARILLQISKDIVTVSESGIETRDDIEKLEQAGVHAALVGETLMRSEDPQETLRTLLTPLKRATR